MSRSITVRSSYRVGWGDEGTPAVNSGGQWQDELEVDGKMPLGALSVRRL